MRVSPSLADSDNGQAPPRSSAASPDSPRARRISATQPPAPYAQTQIAPTPSASVLMSLCVGAAPRDCTTTSHPFQTCCCIGTDADDDASPPEPSRTGASAELRLLIFANTWLRPPRLRARLPRSEMLPETRLVRVGVAPRLFAKSTSDTCGQGRPSSRKPREKLGRRRAPCGGAPGSRILPGPCRVRRR